MAQPVRTEKYGTPITSSHNLAPITSSHREVRSPKKCILEYLGPNTSSHNLFVYGATSEDRKIYGARTE